jgi:HAD superfamily hydrolase (TIGR01450 family)
VTEAPPDRLYAAYVCDLDGTVYLGDELLPGAQRFVATLRDNGAAVRFVSNNPTRDPQQYAEKLARLGLPTPVEHIVNTTVTMTRWLLEHRPGAKVFPIAEEPLKRALTAAGIATSEDPTEIDVVVASYDRRFDYRKLQIAFDAIRTHGRATLVATNPDRFCPLPGGHGEPDCAAVTAAIEACTATTCEAVVGKPDPAMLAAALDGLDVAPADCLVVGDRLGTDIRLGTNAGMPTALVLTGDTQRDDLRGVPDDEQPTFVVDRIDALLP